MLESKISQFTFSADGKILWQAKVNNPLPGVAVAILEKGVHALKPIIKVIENDHTAKHDKMVIKNHLNLWLNTHLLEVLEPLMLLEQPQGMEIKTDAVSQIAAKVYDGLGIVPRNILEDIIAELTPETRTDLRAKKIRLGPVLAFIPALNKPAAVKMRAMLWSLFNGQNLPANVPADGIVSVKINGDNINEEYYRSIGYPIYGGRAVRIDMLDRVINCVYDNAQGGKFQARHEMAEWLGCPINDLYDVLETMGHTKIYDPADNVIEEDKELKDKSQPNENSAVTPVSDKETKKKEESKDKVDCEDLSKSQNTKPELATFRLKKGKAFAKAGGEDRQNKSTPNTKKFSKSDKKKDFKKNKQQGKKPKKDNGQRVISAQAKVNADDSPFAILQKLKK